MKVLIAGCGYVGLALGAELVRRGHQVTGLRRTHPAKGGLEAVGIRPLLADLTNPESLPDLRGGYDWVVHCVSASGGGRAEYERVYVDGTRHLLAWLASNPPRKLVYTSSTSVYGQTDGSLVDETSLASPKSSTGRILLRAEQLLLDAAHNGAFPAIILRVAGIYGPARAYWLEQLRLGTARIAGTGQRLMNMIHREDVVGAISAGLEHGLPGEIYNAVDHEPVRQRVFLEWLAARLNLPLPEHLPANEGALVKRGITDKRVSNRKLVEQLGYRFSFPNFREGYDSLLRA